MKTSIRTFLVLISIVAVLLSITPTLSAGDGGQNSRPCGDEKVTLSDEVSDATAGHEASSSLAPDLSADQLEVTESPATITLEASEPTDIRLGILATDKLVAPTIAGSALAGELLTDSVLIVQPDGTASFAYSDLFSRHFRGRQQHLAPGEDLEHLLNLPDGYPRPKVLLDTHSLDVEYLIFDSEGDHLWWAGEIVYKFDLGLPVTDFRLSSADGRRKTMIGDPAWQEAGRGVEILASNDGTTWTEIWRSHGRGEVSEVDAEFPSSLLGYPTAYLKFRGEEHMLFDLHVSAELDASELASILHLEAGSTDLEFTDAANSSHQAIIFWQGSGVRRSATDTDQLEYPASQPQVVESEDGITILFPEQVGISLQRSPGKGITGIQRLFVGQRAVLSAPPVTITPPWLDTLSDGEVGGVTDWAAYLEERAAINEGIPEEEWRWPQRGGRETHTLDLDGAEYLGYRADEGSVAIRTRVSDGDVTGEMEWIISPVSRELGDRSYSGLGWKVKVMEGLGQATTLRVMEPAVIRFGDWAFAQTWGDFIETGVDFSTPFNVPEYWYFGDTQPFYYAGGPGGSVVSFFDTPVAAQVAIAEEAGRHLLNLRVPLGAGLVRETPVKVWLWTDDAFPTKWAALDEWTAVYDATADRYRSSLGLGVTEPQPALIANVPDEEYMQRYWENGPPEYEDSFHYNFAHSKLLEAAELGFRILVFDMHWDTDAIYLPTPERYLPGSLSFGSGNAPWRLEINDALGGERALQELVDRADELGVEVILWIPPAHLSNSSPLLQEHPEWIKWRSDGIPETAGYRDITGTSLTSGWYDYAIVQYQGIQQATGFDGVLIDSWLTFAMLPDGSEEQPEPQLDQAIALQRDLQQMGAAQIMIEGTSPFGLSSGGYGLEGYLGGGPEGQAMAKRLYERIEGREYGLYRYIADTIPDAASYYRALASKGVIGIWNLDVLATLPEDQHDGIVQANHDYVQVSDKMERRHLIAEGDTWQGVAWTRRGSRDQVLFAFDRFHYLLAGRATIEDITAGITLSAEGGFETAPMHTYIVTQCPDFVDPAGVSVEDIMAVAVRWGMDSADPNWDSRYDLNDDEVITIVDVMLVAKHWGETCQS